MNDATTAPAAAERAYAVAPPAAPETRDLCDGKRVPLAKAEAALAELGPGWRFPTPHEEYAAIDYSYKNANGALSRDESRTPDPYWTCQPWPTVASARVVVWFDDGYVGGSYGYDHARARAVRVAGQSSDIGAN